MIGANLRHKSSAKPALTAFALLASITFARPAAGYHAERMFIPPRAGPLNVKFDPHPGARPENALVIVTLEWIDDDLAPCTAPDPFASLNGFLVPAYGDVVVFIPRYDRGPDITIDTGPCPVGVTNIRYSQVEVPLAPTDVRASRLSPTSVLISWTDASQGLAEGFDVARKPRFGTEWTHLADLDAGSTVFVDGNLNPAQGYVYSIAAKSKTPLTSAATVTIPGNVPPEPRLDVFDANPEYTGCVNSRAGADDQGCLLLPMQQITAREIKALATFRPHLPRALSRAEETSYDCGEGVCSDGDFPERFNVRAVAADGVSLLLLRFVAPGAIPGQVTFELPGLVNPAKQGSVWQVDDSSLVDPDPAGGDRDMGHAGAPAQPGPTRITVPTQVVGNETYAFALYRAPRNFDDEEGENELFRDRRVAIDATLVPTDPAAVRKTTPVDIAVVRPPVILIHGTWDTAAGWDEFSLWKNCPNEEGGLISSSSCPQSVFRVNFEQNNAGSLDVNARLVLEQIQEKLRKFRFNEDIREDLGSFFDNHIAVAQADVITHSYAGPIVRAASELQALPEDPLSRSDPNRSARTAFNWGHGPIHKLITIAGTHTGSHLANASAYLNEKSFGLFGQTARAIGLPFHCGAARDQLVGSDALRSLGPTRFPSHAVVGSGIPSCSVVTSIAQLGGLPLAAEAVPFAMYRFFGGSFDPFGPYGLPAGPFLTPLVPCSFVADPAQRVLCISNALAESSSTLLNVSNFVFNRSYDSGARPRVAGPACADDLFQNDLPWPSGDAPNYDLTVRAPSMAGGITPLTPFPSAAALPMTDIHRLDPDGGFQISTPFGGRFTHLRERRSFDSAFPDLGPKIRALLQAATDSPFFGRFPAVEDALTDEDRDVMAESSQCALQRALDEGQKPACEDDVQRLALGLPVDHTPSCPHAGQSNRASLGAPLAEPEDTPQIVLDDGDGTVFPGQQLHGTISWSGRTILLTLLFAPTNHADDRTGSVILGPEGTFELEVPNVDRGPIQLGALVQSESGEVGVATVDLELVDDRGYDFIFVEPEDVVLVGSGISSLRVHCSGCGPGEITGSPRLTYTVLDPSVAELLPGGRIRGVRPGRTQIEITTAEGGFASVDVVVHGLPVELAVDPNQSDPVVDRDDDRPIPLALLSTPGFAPTDVQPESIEISRVFPLPTFGPSLVVGPAPFVDGALTRSLNLNADGVPDLVFQAPRSAFDLEGEQFEVAVSARLASGVGIEGIALARAAKFSDEQTFCGDAVLSPDEHCDPERVLDVCAPGEECSPDCTECLPRVLCGDGVVSSGETCDPGVPSSCSPGSLCLSGCSTCRPVTPSGNDSDGDGVSDADDRCPNRANPGQEDLDGDGLGDVCDSNDAPLSIRRILVQQGTRGKVHVRGDIAASSGRVALDASQGIALRITDGGALDEVYRWGPGDCSPRRGGKRLDCRGPERRLRLAATSDRTSFIATVRTQLNGPLLPHLSASLTHLPGTPVVGIDHEGEAHGCKASRKSVRCRRAA